MSEKKPGTLLNALFGIFFQAVINVGLGIVILYFAGVEVDHGRDYPGIMYALGYLSVVIGIVLAVCGVLLVRRVEWARIPVAVIEVLGIVSGVITLASGVMTGIVNVGLGAVVLVSLFKAPTTAWLRPTPSS
ncbi:MAG TPA: hypothetical protein VGP26_08620 [Actinophytocola sp.]|jgi:hypothetical protein|nr:hypothetical protein [Actinophytocola sp.]